MKNICRNKKSEAGVLKRKCPMEKDDLTPPPNIKKAHRGEMNWAIEIPEGEDEQTQKKHQDDMKKENQKTSPKYKLIERRMEITYSQRRQFINLNPPVAEIKEQFPCLFEMDGLDNEFRRLMGTNLHTKFNISLKNIAPDILTLAKASKKISAAEGKIFHRLESEIRTANFEKVGELQATAAILVLPYLLGNHPDVLRKEFKDDCTQELIIDSAKSGEPFVAIVGDVMNPKCCYIIAEKVVLMETSSVTNAVSSAVGIYYACNLEFQKKAMETLVFIQKFLLEINDQIKTPRRVISLAEKLRK